MYMQSRVIKKSVLSICQSDSVLVDLFGQNIKACMLTGLKITSGIILISHNPIVVMIKQTQTLDTCL